MSAQAHRPGVSPRRAGIAAIWAAAAVLVVAEAAHELFGLGGPGSDRLFNDWLHNSLLWAASGLCLAGALRTRRSRGAWALAALAIASWAAGETIWSLRYAGTDLTPVPTVSDLLWLAWYPLMGAALTLLVRDRVPVFELHRWIDGVVVMLIVATPWVALFLQPVAEESSAGRLAEAIEFAYPLGDLVLVGGVLGVYALMTWRPGRMWLVLGLGLTVMGVADAVYSVQTLAESYEAGVYDAAWVAGALLVASAAWQPHPARLEPSEVAGWPAIALPLAAQALAVAVQIYGLVHELASSERILTITVLLIAAAQIIVTRPRRRAKRPGSDLAT
jgi:hypothetical protein